MAKITTTDINAFLNNFTNAIYGVVENLYDTGRNTTESAFIIRNADEGTTNYGAGSITSTVTAKEKLLQVKDVYKNYPVSNSDTLTGSTTDAFTGSKLNSASDANATGYKHTSSTLETDSTSKLNEKESLTTKLSINPFDTANFSISQAKSQSSNQYTRLDRNESNKNTYSYTFNGLSNHEQNSLIDFELNIFSSKNKSTYKDNQASANWSSDVAFKSASGLFFDNASSSFTGNLDSFKYTSKIAVKTSSESLSSTEKYQLGAFTEQMLNALSDYYANQTSSNKLSLLEALLSGNDTIKGHSKHDSYLYGGAGNDVLTGGKGNDKLEGGLGNDTLKGGKGNDLLIGGAGTDILKGGAGADQFIFFAGDSTADRTTMDTVTDFKIKQNDKLVFNFDNTTLTDDDIVIALGKTDKQSSYDDLLAAAQTAAQDNGTLIYVGYTSQDKKNGYAFVDLDGNGTIDMGIKLTGVTSVGKIDKGSFSSNLDDYDNYTPFQIAL